MTTNNIVMQINKLESQIGEIDADVYNAFTAIKCGEVDNDVVLTLLSNALDSLQTIRGNKPRNLIQDIPVSDRTILAHMKKPVPAFLQTDTHGCHVTTYIDEDKKTPVVQIDTPDMPENNKGPLLKVFLNDSTLFRNRNMRD